MPAKAPKASELINRLNVLLGEPVFNEFELYSIKSQAEKLKQKNPADAYVLLGIIGCLKADVVKTRENHKAAIHLLNDAASYSLFVTSLQNLMLHGEAIEYAKKAYELERGNKMYLEQWINCLYNTFQFTAALNLVRTEWDKISPENEFAKVEGLEGAVEFQKVNNLNDSQTSSVYNSVVPLFEKGKRITTIHSGVREDEEEAWYFCSYNIDLEAEDVVDFNLEAADLITQNADSEASKFVIVNFK